MQHLNRIEEQVKSFQDKFGTDIIMGQQGSDAWLKTRLGVVTASEVSKAVAKVGTETRNTYLCQLVAEVATGVAEEINSKYMDWGKRHEDAARAIYEFERGVEIIQVPFIFKDDTFREGVSLDGFISGKNKAAEIKCPYNSTNYIKFLVDDKIKAEYQWQYQYQIRCTGVDEIDFIQYDNRMKTKQHKVLTVGRDDEYQAKFEELIPAFLRDMDEMLKKIGISYGDQWRRLAVGESEGVA